MGIFNYILSLIGGVFLVSTFGFFIVTIMINVNNDTNFSVWQIPPFIKVPIVLIILFSFIIGSFSPLLQVIFIACVSGYAFCNIF